MNTKTLTYAVVIPARFESSRLPGKPLVDLLGKPMLQHVHERCATAVGEKNVYVATDDTRIKEASLAFGASVIMTSSTCLTGTDRLAEVNDKLNFDFIINVQGDEPLVDPDAIIKVIEQYKKTPGLVVNAMCSIESEDDFNSPNTPKVVFTKSGRLSYMSRSPIPNNKTFTNRIGFKQVCIYAFSREHLKFFSESTAKTPIENIEDIEILRFLENDIPVQMIEVAKGSIAVDVQSDVAKVIKEMSK